MTDNEPEPTEEELEERLKKLLGEAATADPEELDEVELKLHEIEEKLSIAGQPSVDTEDIDARLRAIEDRAKKLRNIKALPEAERSSKTAQTEASYRGLGVGITVAYALVGPLFVGYGIGWLIDRKSGGTTFQMWGTLLGLFSGFGAALFMLNRAEKTGPKKQ